MTESGRVASTTGVVFELASQLEIPTTLYKKAESRYAGLADWFHRKESALSEADCMVYPQGSFRLGTVVRPLDPKQEYDLDLVCSVAVDRRSTSQMTLKAVVGEEVRAYAKAMQIRQRVEEKKRCWRLNYTDDVPFHMDILPATPDDARFVDALVAQGVPRPLAQYTVAITDKDHHDYEVLGADWPKSNPKGYATWFESRMQEVAGLRIKALVDSLQYKSIDEVPAYEWKTPLQQAIQILKRHRDVMFRTNRQARPISMIITTLAAESYRGEPDVLSALRRIVADMPQRIRAARPLVPNPVNPAEDFADAWQANPDLRAAFFDWHTQLSLDTQMAAEIADPAALIDFASARFAVQLPIDRAKASLGATGHAGHVVRPEVVTRIAPNAPRPWGGE